MSTQQATLREQTQSIFSQKRIIDVAGRGLFWLLVLVIAFYTIAPFAYAISISFRTNSAVLVSARYLPESLNVINYQNLLEDKDFMRTMLNSSVVATVTVLLALVVGSFAAYALGRVQFRGRMVVMYTVLAMTMFPQISILSGLFAIVTQLNIFGSTAALMFTYPIFTLPFTVWVLTSFFRGLPAEIEQAALVDGATPFQTFWRILVPLTAPALVTTGLLAFIASWNEYLFALTFTLVNKSAQTVPVAIANFSGYGYEIPVADRAAATVIVTIPVLVLVLIFQRRIIEGLTAGAVKG
jgi:trehalose/maltose transport system permease protein